MSLSINTEPLAKEFANALNSHLGSEDDPQFWDVVFRTVLRDIELQHFEEDEKHEIFLQIGACSHWLRPHQTRLTADGGFAYPSGYLGGSGFSRNGLPEFDWYVIVHRDQHKRKWVLTDKFFGKRRLICRVALPTRTLRHNQAAIHLMWTPGTPPQPAQKEVMYYGFRKREGAWQCTVWGDLQNLRAT